MAEVSTYDTWSNLANVLLAEGFKAAMAQRLEGVRVVCSDARHTYEVIGSEWDSKNSTVKLLIERTEESQ